jgi:pilus assembly protein CpaB
MDPNRSKLLASLALGALAAGLCWLYLSGREQALLHRGEEREVLEASRYIPAYTRLDENYLERRKIPGEYLPKGVVSKIEEVRDLVTLAPFNARELIFFNKLAHSSQSLAAVVPEGQRAFTVPMDAVSGLNGLVRPGDDVDVLFLAEAEKGKAPGMVGTLFQDTRVVAVGGQYAPGDKASGDAPATVTLALSPRDCQVALMAQSRGHLQLALRAPDDRLPLDLATMEYSAVLQRFREHPAPERPDTVEVFHGPDKEDFILQKK